MGCLYERLQRSGGALSAEERSEPLRRWTEAFLGGELGAELGCRVGHLKCGAGDLGVGDCQSGSRTRLQAFPSKAAIILNMSCQCQYLSLVEDVLRGQSDWFDLNYKHPNLGLNPF